MLNPAKEMGAVSCLMVGLFLGVNAMVNEERNGWLMWAILFLAAALALWLWMMREQRSAEEEAEDALKAAEESLNKIEAKTAPEKPAPSPKPEVQTKPEPKAETKPIPAPPPIEAPNIEPIPSPKEEPKPVPVEVPKVEVKPAAAATPSVPTVSAEPDDLTRIEGVGPKYAEILIGAGIDSFAKLAALSEDAIVEIVRQGGGRKAASIGTWAEQAKLAAASDWDGLAKLQAQLSGGRK